MLSYRISESLVLKPIQPHHAAEMFAVIDRNREFLKQWLGWLDTTKAVEDSQKFIQELQASYLESGAFTCGIWYENQFCGLVGFNTIDWEARSANLGYWIAEKFQNLGIMTQCCRAFIDHSFNEYQLNRIEIHIAVENHRSQALAERLGFTKESITPNAEWLYDHNVDHTVNVLIRN